MDRYVIVFGKINVIIIKLFYCFMFLFSLFSVLDMLGSIKSLFLFLRTLGNCFVDDIGKTNSGSNIASLNVPHLDMLPGGPDEQYLPSHNAWVRCDYCLKWRRIPAELADSIEETKCTWYNIIHFMFDHFKSTYYVEIIRF